MNKSEKKRNRPKGRLFSLSCKNCDGALNSPLAHLIKRCPEKMNQTEEWKMNHAEERKMKQTEEWKNGLNRRVGKMKQMIKR